MAKDKQTRWMCNDCYREWVKASELNTDGTTREWESKDGCPAPMCRSQNISKVEYDPGFPGGDIPRGETTQADIHAAMLAVYQQNFTQPLEPNILLSEN